MTIALENWHKFRHGKTLALIIINIILVATNKPFSENQNKAQNMLNAKKELTKALKAEKVIYNPKKIGNWSGKPYITKYGK